ncbi:hypothetical protein WMF20_30435 [Sorangium sp. So ce834]|uniref:hypothetical protein n=1 Tax=Sorangium sp. So ce834 TaxID=3133321 RepID=UPI003F640EB2
MDVKEPQQMNAIFAEAFNGMQAGDIAPLQGEWSLSFVGPDGEEVTETARSAEVVRRQLDGTWRYLIDHPAGDDTPR